MKKISTAVAALLLLFIVACTNASKKEQEFDTLKREVSDVNGNVNADFKPDYFGVTTDSTDLPQQTGDPEKKKQPNPSQPIPNPDWDKKIIKTANLNLEVKDYNAFYASTRERIRSFGGYVAQEEQQQSEYKLENTLSIKVPVDQFDNALTQISTGVEKINEKKVTSQDVTSEYIDTRSRIEAKKQVRLRYMDLLKQAKNMEEILSVQSEINGIQEEIESATGRVEYLGHSSAYSTIHLTFYQVLNASAKGNDAPPSLGTKIGNAFKTGWGWIVDLFVGLVSIWPLCLLVFVLVIIYRKTRIAKPKEEVG